MTMYYGPLTKTLSTNPYYSPTAPTSTAPKPAPSYAAPVQTSAGAGTLEGGGGSFSLIPGVSMSARSSPTDPNSTPFVSYTQPFGSTDPNNPTPAAQRASTAGNWRLGKNGITTDPNYLSSIARGLTPPPDPYSVQGSALPPGFLSAMLQKQNLTMDDFGIPKAARQQMESSQEQQIMDQADMQKQAARRLLASQGLTNDSAMNKGMNTIDRQAQQTAAATRGNIESQSAIQANQQFLQNLNDLVSGSLQGGQFQENSRQYNVGALMDTARLDRATQEWQQQEQDTRARMSEAIAEWLEGYDLDRINASAGTSNAQRQSAAQREQQLGGLSSSVGQAGGIFGSLFPNNTTSAPSSAASWASGVAGRA